MIDFEYQVKTKLYFGKDKENEIGHILSSLNVKNVLLVYGKSSIKQNGLYDKIINYISNENIAIYELSGIRANPSIESVKQGVKIGDGAVIGANSFVNKDVEPFSIVVGSPAKHLKYRFGKETQDEIRNSSYWDEKPEKAKQILNTFSHINY